MVAFDARSTDEQRSARSKLAARRDELHRFGQQLDSAPARARIRIELGGEPVRTVSRTEARAAIARIEGEITCETMLLDLDRRSIDLGTAAHEMIHQLAAESGLVPRHDAFPALAARRLGGAVRGDPRRPLVGNQPCPRPAACLIGGEFKTRFRWSAWSETPDSAVAINATFTRRPGPWFTTCAPGIRESF